MPSLLCGLGLEGRRSGSSPTAPDTRGRAPPCGSPVQTTVAGRCTLLCMSEDEDPAASTQMFQAFVDRRDEPEASGSRWIWGAVAVAVVIVLVLAWVLLGG